MTATVADAAESITILESINTALADALADDEKVLVLGEDIADGEEGGVMGATRGLSTRFGNDRVRSTPISEQAIIGAAIGASLKGYKPVAEIMLMNFITVAMDMIVNHAAKLRFMSGGQTNVPITIRTMTGRGYGTGGQHCDYMESWFAHTAGIKVVAPSNAEDAYGLLRSCIDDPDPCLFIESIVSYSNKGVPASTGARIPLGKAKVVREGSDVTVVSYSRTLNDSVAAAEALANEGISAEVIDLRTVSPWDKETVFSSVKKTGRVLVAHEAVMQFGVGAEVASTIQQALFSDLKKPVERMGAKYSPVPFSKPLEDAYAPNVEDIKAVVKALAEN